MTVSQLAYSETLPINNDTLPQLHEISNSVDPIENTEVARRVCALRYRLGSYAKEYSAAVQTTLENAASAWKQAHPLIRDAALRVKERERLEESAQFPYFVELLAGNDSLADNFFKWTLQGNCRPDVFVQYPDLSAKLMNGLLHGRLRYFGDQGLDIRETDQGKVPTLLFEGQPVSLLDREREVALRGGMTVKVGKVLDDLTARRTNMSTIEYLSNGITNYHAFEHGHWDETLKRYVRIDLEREDWWNQLPVIQELTEEDVREEFGVEPAGQMVAVLKASRELPYVSAKGHAWIQVLAPQQDGSYHSYTFGKSVKEYPKGLLATLLYLPNSDAQGAVLSPDKNTFRVDREEIGVPFVLTAEESSSLMSRIKADMQRTHEDRLLFQSMGANCSEWAWGTIARACPTREIPPYFQVRFLDIRYKGITDRLLGAIRSISIQWLQQLALRVLFVALGIWRSVTIDGERFSSWNRPELWDRGLVHMPSGLWEAI